MARVVTVTNSGSSHSFGDYPVERRQQFFHSPLPYLFLAPQILIIAVFFIYPAAKAVYLSFMLEDPWGTSSLFVWFENYQMLFESSEYLSSIGFTLMFAIVVSFLSLALALLLAVKADITEDALIASGLLRRKKDGVRVLAKGEITSKVKIIVHGASKGAVEAVEKAGGSLTVTGPVKAAAE